MHHGSTFVSLLLLSLFGFCLYANTFGNTWTYDDTYVILQNTDILSFKGFFENTYPGRPLRELSFMLDYALFGRVPTGWHAQNILWHVLNAWLVFLLAKRLTAKPRVYWLASLLFLTHPVQVEVAAQTSHRKDSLCLFFILLAVNLYLYYRDSRSRMALCGIVLSAPLGFLAKETALLLPLFILLHVGLFAESTKVKKLFRPLLALLVLIGCGLGLYLWRDVSFLQRAESLLIGNGYVNGFDWAVYAKGVINGWGFSLWQLLAPLNLSVNYFLPPPESWFSGPMLRAYFVLIPLAAGLALSLRRWPSLFFALFWLCLFSLSTANLLPINFFAADRYLYIPSVGFCLLAALLIDRLIRPDWAHSVLLVALVLSLSVLTVRQNATWLNNATLWTQSLKVNPESSRATSNVGSMVYGRDLNRNLQMQQRAVALNGQNPFAHYRLGLLYQRKGQRDNARKHLNESLRVFRPEAHAMYGRMISDIKARLQTLD